MTLDSNFKSSENKNTSKLNNIVLKEESLKDKVRQVKRSVDSKEKACLKEENM